MELSCKAIQSWVAFSVDPTSVIPPVTCDSSHGVNRIPALVSRIESVSDEILDIHIDVVDDEPSQAGLLKEFTVLRKSIAALPVVRVRSGTSHAEPGTKATNAFDISHIVVTLVPSAAIIGAITRVCVERIKAGATREVHLKLGGNELRLTGIDAAQQARAVEEWTQAVLDGRSTE